MEMKIQCNPELVKAIEIAEKAKTLRDEAAKARLKAEADNHLKKSRLERAEALKSEATELECMAVSEFKKFRAETLDSLKANEKKLMSVLEVNEDENIRKKLQDNHSRIEEICILFGHEVECIKDHPQTFRCICCNKEMSYPEYVMSHFKEAIYRGGVVEYAFFDDSPCVFA